MKKREISDIEKEECKLLKQLFNDRKKELGLSQAKIADLIGVTQAAINHYLNGTNALNASIASESFNTQPPEGGCVVNYTDNIYLPEVLRLEAESCKERDYDLYRHIWLGEPVADSELSVIKPKWIDASVDAHIKLKFEATGQRILGFDVADEGDDASATILRHGSVIIDMDEWRGQDVIYSADKVYLYGQDVKADKIIFDSIGVGAGVKAQFRRKTGKVQTIGFNAGGSVFKPEA